MQQVLLVRPPQLHGAAAPRLRGRRSCRWKELIGQKPALQKRDSPSICLWLRRAGPFGGSLKSPLGTRCLKSQPKDVGFPRVCAVVAVGCGGEG